MKPAFFIVCAISWAALSWGIPTRYEQLVMPLLMKLANNVLFREDPALSLEENALRFRNGLPHVPKSSSYKLEELHFTNRDGVTLPINLYVPHTSTQKRPIFFYIHGGGWISGDQTDVTIFGANLDVLIFSVYYRLAPEYRFPAAPHDCYDALVWVAENAAKYGGDVTNIIVGGSSAGTISIPQGSGNLAAATTLMAKENNGPKIAKQFLEIPLLSFVLNERSMAAGHHYYIWDTIRQIRSRFLYLDEKDYKDYRASPLFAKNHTGLPPALIIACELDCLYDSALLYHEKLLSAGVSSTIVDLKETPHGGYHLPLMYLPEKKIVLDALTKFINNK